MSSAAIANAKLSPADNVALAVNRNKLMKLAEGVKTKKKPANKKSFNFKKDPGYANIEHLVFGVYRPRTSLAASPNRGQERDRCLVDRNGPITESLALGRSAEPHQEFTPNPRCYLNASFSLESTQDDTHKPNQDVEPTCDCYGALRPITVNEEESSDAVRTLSSRICFSGTKEGPHCLDTLNFTPKPIWGVNPPCDYGDSRPFTANEDESSDAVRTLSSLSSRACVSGSKEGSRCLDTSEDYGDFRPKLNGDVKTPAYGDDGPLNTNEDSTLDTSSSWSARASDSDAQVDLSFDTVEYQLRNGTVDEDLSSDLTEDSVRTLDGQSSGVYDFGANTLDEMGVPVRKLPIPSVRKSSSHAQVRNGPRDPAATCRCKMAPCVCKCGISNVHSIRKIAVSSSHPARPIVSTRVTVTVNASSGSVKTMTRDHRGDPKAPPPDRTPPRTNIPRCSVDTVRTRQSNGKGLGAPGSTPRHYGADLGLRRSSTGPVKAVNGAMGPKDGVEPHQGSSCTTKPSRLRQPLRTSVHLPGKVTVLPRTSRALSCPGPSTKQRTSTVNGVVNGDPRVPRCETSEDGAPLSSAPPDVVVQCDVEVAPSVSDVLKPEEENGNGGDNGEFVVPQGKGDLEEDLCGTIRAIGDEEKGPLDEELTPKGTSCSKELRRRKASSSPVFMEAAPETTVDDAKRSWSQLYSDKDLERFMNSKTTDEAGSCRSLNSEAPTPLTPSTPSLFARFASMRSQPPRNGPVEGVLQKFRKSFSVRFYKKGPSKGPEDLSPSPGPLTSKSRFYTSAEAGLECPLEQGASGSLETIATVTPFGPLTWRSSREGKDKLDSGSLAVTCPSTPVHLGHQDVPRRRAMSGSGNGEQRRPSLPSTVASKRALAASAYLTLSARRNSSCLVNGASSTALQSEEISPSCIRRGPRLKRSKAMSRLRRSVSQPIDLGKLETYGSCCLRSPAGITSDREDLGDSSSCSGSERDLGSRLRAKDLSRFSGSSSEAIVYGEALWDHVTMDHEELALKAGDMVEILDTTDPNHWFGVKGHRCGWFPASFVRLKVNQEREDQVVRTSEQVRTNVIMEIVSTERDFVRHLKDVIQGYLKQMRKRPDMFSSACVGAIFGNIEQMHEFQSRFLRDLEAAIDWQRPHLSNVGSCFTQHRQGFQVYSEYCNNHPQAVRELQELYAVPKYAHFFEACRLLQDMIDISLDGFLLTPVQKICKYPLQLAELLKYTCEGHPDASGVQEALEAMRGVAQYINERKRRMECLEKLAAWQLTVEDWEGPHLLQRSSELIHTGDASKVAVAWSRDITLFLFDHQLVLCKRDLLKKNSYTYKGRLDMDNSHVVDVPDGKDPQTGISVKHAWKVFCRERNKCMVLAARTAQDKKTWLEAFRNERRRVDEDSSQGFVVPQSAKDAAVKNAAKSKRPKDKEKGGWARGSSRSGPYADRRSKSGSLPRSMILSTAKKKNSSGWFHFGSSSKKSKR